MEESSELEFKKQNVLKLTNLIKSKNYWKVLVFCYRNQYSLKEDIGHDYIKIVDRTELALAKFLSNAFKYLFISFIALIAILKYFINVEFDLSQLWIINVSLLLSVLYLILQVFFSRIIHRGSIKLIRISIKMVSKYT